MTAESTVSSPGAQPRDHGFPSVSVLPARASGSFRLPPRRPPARPASPLPLLAADLLAALVGAVSLDEATRRPVLVAVLAAGALLLRPQPARPVPGVLDELPRVCGRIAVAWLGLATLLAAHDPERALTAPALLLGWALHAVAACAGRGTVHWRRRVALVRHPRTALVIGSAATAQRVASALLRHPRCGVRPVGVVAERPEGAGGLPVLTTDEEVERALIQNGVRVVLTVHPTVRAEKGPLLRALAGSGCSLWEVEADTPAYEMRDRLAGFSVRRLDLGPRRRGNAGKRLLDVLVSGTLLVLVSPVLLVCAVVLRLTDGPGVVFRQERIGKGGRPFTLLKFRTHRPVDEHEAATRWSVAGERRMSPFCRFLRQTSLDELLQLWNVFWGDMSLVGPRPERPYFVAQFSRTYPGYAARHRMQTGITGLAQVNGLRGDTSIEDRARFDNAYIDDWSLWQDVCILLRTAATLVRPTGS
ncbi:exopolysaccharide biosynthesis polyprenyl glycosylphosphotransferase [Streptomyces actinomycinicus]|uniref:Exopolysaccharide biosynthesis polyprenyl glycosylphosphotransferase n=1 Tax=Streptomyces actinomycinicus TaxID=1695166 RepID=A0A937EE85_9ACTN|nr:exopolysaccharide biosynthesis polyprenyl glycosylphosphotransferase [Streptomyces actinomycinicus]MBL1080596.1 exopolysaccharide biosynthesis polyprenyl glycosylphosphotransferase [Streptomyces actinomycinicus]